MSNNTYKHTSDLARFKEFDPTGTAFPPDVIDVQTALAMAGPSVPASETVSGRIQIATLAEVDAGTNNTKAITPKTLEYRMQRPEATTTVRGVIRIATRPEVQAGTVANAVVTPLELSGYFAFRTATEARNGTIKLANTAMAVAGTDDTAAMTPLKVQQAIANATAQIPSYTPATETNQGTVKLALLGQLEQGTLREGVAVSPYSLAQLIGNATRRGIVQAATLAQANAGTDDSLFISAKGFKSYIASTTQVGTVKLTDTIATGAGLALSGNAKVLALNGTNQTVTGTVNFTGSPQRSGSPLASEKYVDDAVMVGSMMMYFGSTIEGDLWQFADGGAMSKAAYPKLFALLGYDFGGSGDVFFKPDMRGLFARGAGVGKDILAARGVDGKNKPLLGNDVEGGAVGEVQKQQTRTHKHVVPWGESYGNSSFGQTATRHYVGSGKSDSNNPRFFTNDGLEVDDINHRGDYNTVNTVEAMGPETRPWNMSVNYIIKVK